MKSKEFKGYFEWSVVVLVVLLILSLSTRLTIGQEFVSGVFLNSSNATGYTLNEPISATNDTGANMTGIFIDNNTAYTLSNLTINATLTVNQTNSVSGNMTFGIYANGTFDNTAPNIGNLTITGNGAINVSANGTAVFAGGIAVGNVTNLINNGTISVFGNVTDPSGKLMVGGVYAVNAPNVVNNGNVTVRGTGGYVDYAENNVPAGFEIASLGNFTNTGNINVSIESVNATAVGVRSYDIGYFNNTGNISVFTNSTSGDSSAVIGVMAGQPDEFGGAHSGHIGTFINSGNLTVAGYASGGVLRAYGVAVFNGTIDEFQNSGRIEVYGNNIGGNATVYGVGAIKDKDTGGYGNLTNFINAGLINATAIGSNATSSGVHADDYIGNFTGNGTISVSALATATGGEAEAYGVSANTIDNFRLETGGKITVTANGGSVAYASGVEAGDIGSFTGNGTISVSATATATGGEAVAYGVSAYTIDNFRLETGGKITVTANGTSFAIASGVEAGDIGNFTNRGTIEMSAIATNGDARARGVYARSIGNFTNAGVISVVTQGGTGEGADNVIGVYVNSAGNITNLSSGKIEVKSEAGNVTTANSRLTLKEIYGFRSPVDDPSSSVNQFLNNGTISVQILAGNANATNSTIEVNNTFAVKARIANFTNQNSISLTVKAGDASGSNSTVIITDLAGVDIWGLKTFNNTGTINVMVEGGNKSEIRNISGLLVKNSTNATITNLGDIAVNINAPNAKSVNNVAGITIWNSDNVTISNAGSISLSVFSSNPANVRTLYIYNSNVTLRDKFALTFGAPGTGPETAPIYVASGSTLNLNNTVLVVRIWNNYAPSIVLNTPYKIIENATDSTVNGNWGGLERGYPHSLIDVRWYNASTDKDAMVIFKYNALNNPAQAMSPVSSITGAVTVNSFISGIVSAVVPVSSPLVFVREDQPVMLAASAVSDMPLGYGMGGATYRGGMWFMPVYTKVKASDLGFDADAYGFNLGFGGFLTRDLSLGLYATYARTDIDYRITGAKSGDVDLFAVGMTGRWTFMKDAYLRFNVNGFKTKNDYEGRTGLNYEMKEKASYDVKGMEGEVMIGKVYRGRIALIPEIGLKYNYYNPDSFWTKASNATGRVPAWDRYYSPSAQHVWKVAAGVNVVGDTKWGGNPVRLYLMGRVEQALGKNEVEVINYMRSDPTRYKLTKSISKTTFVGQVGADVSLTKNFGVELSGRGDFNGDYSAYTGRAVIWYKW